MLWLEKLLGKISILLNLPTLALCSACGQFWRMFYVHMRSMHILLLLDGMLYKYQCLSSLILIEFLRQVDKESTGPVM